MNLRTNISPLQYLILFMNTSIGAGMLTMPRAAASVSREDMWLAVIFSGLVFWIAIWAVTRLSGYFPEYTSIEYHLILLGPVLGQLLNLLQLSLLIVLTTLSMNTFVTALKILILDITPIQVIVAVFLLLSAYATQYGLAPVARMQFSFSLPQYLLLFPLILLGFMSVKTVNFQPMLAKGFIPVLKGVVPAWFSYSGPELIVGLLYSFITRQNTAMQWGSAGILVLTFFYTLITIIVQGILGSSEASHMLVPTITAYRAVEIPDTFIERLDGYLMVLWIPLFFYTHANLVYFSAFCGARILKLENNRPVVLLFVPLFYYLVTVLPSTQASMAIVNFFNLAAMVWSLGIVPLLLGIAWLREKRRGKC